MFPRLSVRENLRVGGYLAGKEQVEAGYERAYSRFPRFEGTGIPVRRHPPQAASSRCWPSPAL